MNNANTNSDNYVGALLFWSYIIAALSLTSLIIVDIWKLYSTCQSNDRSAKRRAAAAPRRSSAQVFLALSVVSFAVLSLHMLFFLVDSYTAWTKAYGVAAPRNILGILTRQVGLDIWKWSHTSTLFENFAKDLCESPRHYWWTSQALTYSMAWNMIMTVQGVRNQVPHMWAYILLGQILPVSLAQNLFCAALILTPSPTTIKSSWYAPQARQTALVAAFFSLLWLAPLVVDTPLDAPVLLATRILLTGPCWILKPAGHQTRTETNTPRLRDAFYLLMLGSLFFMSFQSWRVGSIVSAAKSIHDTHAVSAFGYGYLIGLGSLLVFLTTMGGNYKPIV